MTPDLSTVQLAFEPESFWLAGDYDPAALRETLKQQPELADFDDGEGNRQSAVRLDADEHMGAGFWVTVPAGTARAVIDAAAKAYAAPKPATAAKPPASEAVLVALEKLDPNTATVADVVGAVKAALKAAAV